MQLVMVCLLDLCPVAFIISHKTINVQSVVFMLFDITVLLQL